MSLSYKKSGVNYDLLDPVKRLAQVAGLKTTNNILGSNFREIAGSRGESAYVLEAADCYHAFVQEGLGTKNLVADEMRKITGKTYYDDIAQDTVAAIINDLITVGARPLSVFAYWAVGDSKWFADKKRNKDLVNGWKKACDLAGASWGGGETPTLKDIINPNTIDLAGAAFGIIHPKSRLILGDKLSADDAIILFESNGIHANGLSLARKIASNMPKGYATKLPSGNMYGEKLLAPTIIYSKLINDLLDRGIEIHYMVNITGHGWRKLMRAKRSFTYVIDSIPTVPEIFKFIQTHSGLSDKEMYSTFNMGAGFAIYLSEKEAKKVLSIFQKQKIKTWIAGRVENGPKQVIIKPKNIVYNEIDLNIR